MSPEVPSLLKKAGKPFLLSLHYTAPHWPWECATMRTWLPRWRRTSSPSAVLAL